ncbi:response regulator transcription factor [Glutamicibacter halophytocola]|uniref:Response regulator transcription factor n=1 Tax=Glutamicibacter halophytocola TaxID=1933880 RepID=A0ABX5Y7T7_9MICC|nr:response regulator transcription factor [Glutamicibacter halophytocola]QDY66182.1 response regulator transcription factor [Glutamicibacter halophytocola]
MSRIRVHLADSDYFSRAGISTVLSNTEDFDLENITDSMADAIAGALEQKPDIILIESTLDGQNLYSAIREISEATPRTKVVVMASRYKRSELAQAYDAGSAALISKSSISSELPCALRMLVAGYQLFAAPTDGWEPASRVVRRSIHQEAFRELGDRDRGLVRHVAAGLTNAQISRLAHISEGSVKLHLARVMDELSVSNRVQLAVIAAEAGLVTSADLKIA